MKMIKSLLLGSAAGLVAMSGAQAADLPLKAKAVEYVRVCSLYGAGFYYIPGTDTCIKLSGYLRVDVIANSNSDNTGNTSGTAGARNRWSNGYTWRSREDFDIDTRTATEYGVVRTFFDATFTWTGGGFAPSGTLGSAYDGNATNTNGNGSVAGGSLGVYYAFIQFAGFTIGKAISQFSAPWTAYPANSQFDGLVGGGGTVTGVNQFSYTAEFGNGVSGTLSAQDPSAYYQAGILNLGPAGGAVGFGSSDFASNVAPDLIAMLRVDQAWGLFQASVAAHDNHAGYYNNLIGEQSGHPDDVWGFAGQLALSIKNIPTGPGDTINIQGVYTDGATRYNIQDLAGSAGANTIFGSTGVLGNYGSIGIGNAPDTVFGLNGSQQTIQTWGMRGGYTHNWNPYWNSGIYGAYAAVMYNDNSKTLLCGIPGVSTGTIQAAFGPGITSCNPDYNIAQLGVFTRWTPVKNLTFGVEATYTHLDQKFAGTAVVNGLAVGKPDTTYTLANQDTWLVGFRAQRNW